jgi:hypothetical protein
MMKKLIKSILCLWLISLFIAGCDVFSPRPDIFENPVCEAPCWENITPGITTKTEALALLSNNEAVDQPAYDTNQSFGKFDDEIRFSLYGKRLHGSILLIDDRVSTIILGQRVNIPFKRAIELFGEPESILIIRSGEIYAALLLNPEKGIAYSYFLADRASQIQSEDVVTTVFFFSPKDYQSILDSGILTYHQMSAEKTLDGLKPWEGFGDIDKYFPAAIH